MNLCLRTIASILKYDNQIPYSKRERKNYHDIKKESFKAVKGYYKSEEEIVSKLKEELLGDKNAKNFKTLECSIMDIADDIAYSNYDLEDSFKAGFLTPLDFYILNQNC